MECAQRCRYYSQDLGVVGRGKKRITMQPLPLGVVPGAAAPAASAPPAKKRTLVEAMGGNGSDAIQIGFDAAPGPTFKQEKPAAASATAPVHTGTLFAAAAPDAQPMGSQNPAAANAITEAGASAAAAAPITAVGAAEVSAAEAPTAVAAPVQPAATDAAAAPSMPAFLQAPALNATYGDK